MRPEVSRADPAFAFECGAERGCAGVADLSGRGVDGDLWLLKQAGCQIQAPVREAAHGRLADQIGETVGKRSPRDPHARSQGSHGPRMGWVVVEVAQRRTDHGIGNSAVRRAHLADGVQRALGREPRDFTYYAHTTAATGAWSLNLQ